MSGVADPAGVPSLDARRDAMCAALARNWWALALRGAAAVLFGLYALALPGVAIASLVLVFAAYMLVDGIFAIVAAVRAAERHERWGWMVLEGVLDIVAGVVAFLLPGITLLAFLAILSVWSVISGIALIMAGFRLHGTHGRWLMILSGALSVGWGVLLFFNPLGGAIVLTWWLGAYAIAFGIMLLGLAFRLRNRHAAAPAAPSWA